MYSKHTFGAGANTVNIDLTKNLSKLSEENKLLIRTVEIEKNKRQERFEAFLSYEEKAEDEIKTLKLRIEKLEEIKRHLRDEIKDTNAIIGIFQCENNSLLENVTKKAKPSNTTNTTKFMTPKHTFKPRTNVDQLSG